MPVHFTALPAAFDASLWYRTLFDQTALGVNVTDGQRRLIDCNDAYCRLIRRDRDEIVGRDVSDFSVAGDPDEGAAAIAALVGGAPTYVLEKRLVRGDGTTVWIRLNLSVLSRDDDLYAGILEDISERKHAEAERALALAELRDKTALLERAHDLAKVGTFIVDARSRTISLSAELARMLGAGDDPFEMSVDEYRRTFVHPDDLEWTTRLAESGYRTGRPVSWERRLIRRDGEILWESSHGRYEVDDRGRPVRLIGVVQDISERVRLIDELRSSRARIAAAGDHERLRLERDFHDGAQARLVAVQAKLALAQEHAARHGPLGAQMDEIGHDVEGALEEMRALAHGIYPAALRDYGLDDALRGLAAQAPIPVEVVGRRVGRCAPPVETTVYFCTHEAIQNATKHAGPRATVTIALERRGAQLEFDVTDDGAGFDPGEASDGLGLTNMRDRVGAVGGELEIISAPGQGTRVRATVPVPVHV
ncbi:MAG: hypothetical protein QOF29_439 [bacterium]